MPSNISLLVGLATLAAIGGALIWPAVRRTSRLVEAKIIEKLVRWKPTWFQPDARVFNPADYAADMPGQYNCLADTVDVRPSRWGQYHTWVNVTQAGREVTEQAVDEALRSVHGHTRAHLTSLPWRRKGRKLVLAVAATGEDSLAHLFWLDGKGRWVSKAGANPVELIVDRKLLTKRTINVAGRSCTLVGLYWVRPDSNPTAQWLYAAAVETARVNGRPAPRF